MATHTRPLLRVCLTGPESTGKTTLAQELARALHCEWVPEFAREYAEARNNQLSAADVEPIARGQIANEDRVRGDVVLLDTDLLSTVVYARHYYGACPEWIERAARERRADLYLLLDTDVAWQPDGARDAGGEEREDLFDAFRAALDEFETQWVIVSGDWDARRETVRETARRLLRDRPSSAAGSLPPTR
ncbi:MAG TPA: ATP-binding protein [Thermoanaerobaculia bacterium]|nr:ATP-binding protein [Thermoanaerobaculia bacterium]